MTRWDSLCRGAGCAAWAYFFLYFDVNLGSIHVLPDFVCYLLLWQAIACLEGEERDLSLLRPFCLLLGAWEGADWVLAPFGGSLSGQLLPLDLLAAAVELYFHFQLFTDLARLAERYQGEGERLDRRLLGLRTAQALLQTASAAALCLVPAGMTSLTFPSDVPLAGALAAALLALTLAGLVVALLLMLALFALRRSLRERGAEEGAEPPGGGDL